MQNFQEEQERYTRNEGEQIEKASREALEAIQNGSLMCSSIAVANFLRFKLTVPTFTIDVLALKVIDRFLKEHSR